MRLPVRLGRAGLLATSGAVGVLALSATVGAWAGVLPFTPWSAAVNSAVAHSVAADTASATGTAHANVGNAHSPKLLRQFTSKRAAAGAMVAATPMSGAVQGIDVASFQEQNGINWPNVAASGKQFAAIKVTEGDYYQNPYALGDLARAKATGLAVAAYVFAIPNGGGSSASPVVQADVAISYLKSGSAGVPPIMLDIEYDPYSSSDGTNDCYGLSQSAMGTWVKNFTAEVQSKTGRPAIIYTTTDWWNRCVGSTVSPSGNPLWIAASVTSTTSPAPLPDGWPNGDWTYWQYGTGSVNGVSGSVDLDQLNPNLFTLLNPGDQQYAVGTGSQITPVQLHASQSATYSSPDLPAGLSLDSSTGQITGTPSVTAPGSVSVTVTATNAASDTQSVTFTWSWHGSLTVTAPANQSTAEGLPVGLQVTANDSPAEPPVTFSATGLPPGTSMSPSGKITGWADKPGTYQVTVHAADALGAAGSATFSWTVGLANGTGPAGPVRLGFGGKCLQDAGNKSANGNPAVIWTCNGSAAQQWTYAQDDSLRIHGKCLRSPTTADWKVRIEPCTGSADEQWQPLFPRSVNPSASGATLTLYNPGYGMCLDDPASSTANGTKQVVWYCDGNTKQEWTLPTGPIESGIPGKCADDSGNRTANGNKIDIYRCNGSSAQQWTVHTNATVSIHGKCLTVQGSGTASGTPVVLYKCNGSGGQRWHLIADGGGAMLENLHSKRCLADPGDATTNGRQLEILSCTANDPGRVWRAS